MTSNHPSLDDTTPHNSRPLLRIFVVLLFELVGFGMAIPVLPFLAKDFGADGLMVGLLFALQATGQFAMAPAWGALSDRFGRKPVMIITLAAAAVASCFTAYTWSLLTLFIARILSGMAAGNVSTASAYITDVTDASSRSKGMALIGIAFGGGFVFGPAIGAVIADYGYELTFQVAAGISLVNAFLAFAILKEPRVRKPRLKRITSSVSSLLTRPPVRAMLSISLMYAISVTIMEATFAYFAFDAFGWDVRTVGVVLAVLALLMALVQGGGVSRLSRRLGDRHMTRLGLALLGIGLAGAVLIDNVAWLISFLAISSIGRAFAHPGLMSMTSKTASEEEVGRVMGLFQSTNSLGRIFGPALGGAVYLWVDIRAPFFMAGIILIVTVILWVALNPAVSREPDIAPKPT